MVGLLQRVLPAGCRMRYHVGIDDPSASRLELPCALSGLRLVGRVRLHPVVQLQHEVIVGCASALGNSKQFEHAVAAPDGACERWQKPACDPFKWLTELPVPAVPVRVDI